VNTWSSVWIGPQGTPTASSAASQSRCVRVAITAATIGTSVSR
jgi:hypothetical protein